MATDVSRADYDTIVAAVARLEAQCEELRKAMKSVANGLREALAFKDREMLDTAVRLSADECERAALAPLPARDGQIAFELFE